MRLRHQPQVQPQGGAPAAHCFKPAKTPRKHNHVAQCADDVQRLQVAARPMRVRLSQVEQSIQTPYPEKLS